MVVTVEKNILFIGNFAPLAIQIKQAFQKDIGSITCATNGQEAFELIKTRKFDAVVVSSKLADASGLTVLKKIVSESTDVGTLLITSPDDFALLGEAYKIGSGEWITKPFYPDELRAKIEKIIERESLKAEAEKFRRENERLSGFGSIIGTTPPMREIYAMIKTVAQTDATVIIYGETGTGKELVARSIHACSLHGRGQFVGINCGALPESLLESELFGHEKGAFTDAVRQKRGLVELAHGGTLFLDEIAEISKPMQVRFLRFLQEKEFTRVGGDKALKVDVRIVAATNKDLSLEIGQGKFREDLFYRLNVVPIYLPPLRERMEDLPLLAHHFLQKHSSKIGKDLRDFSASALRQFLSYNWPGNVRELENVIERAVIMSKGPLVDEVKTFDVIPYAAKPSAVIPWLADLNVPFKAAKRYMVEFFEKHYLNWLLKESGGNLTKASRKSHINIKTLIRKMKKYGLRKESFKVSH